MKYFQSISNDYHTDSQVRTLIEYLVTVGETQNVNTLLEELAHQVPKHEGTLMTIAEQLTQQGRQDTLKEMARNLLQSGVDKAAIMKATGFSSRELELISH